LSRGGLRSFPSSPLFFFIIIVVFVKLGRICKVRVDGRRELDDPFGIGNGFVRDLGFGIWGQEAKRKRRRGVLNLGRLLLIGFVLVWEGMGRERRV
jgi:hypothetical protein